MYELLPWPSPSPHSEVVTSAETPEAFCPVRWGNEAGEGGPETWQRKCPSTQILSALVSCSEAAMFGEVTAASLTGLLILPSLSLLSAW